MKKERLQRISVIVGVVLLVCAILTLVLWNWNISHSEKQSASYVSTLQALLPAPRDAIPEPRRDNTMAVLPIDGTDFVGILEMPRYGLALPVGADWGNTYQFPCRFSGSIYDGSLQVGATTQKGQFDFYRELSVGDRILYTDMEGNRYTYEITSLRYESHADQTALQRVDASFTLFIKNIYSFEYLIVFCNEL